MKSIAVGAAAVLWSGIASAAPDQDPVGPAAQAESTASAAGGTARLVSILDFIPRQEWAAIRSCASTYDVRGAEAAAETAVSTPASGAPYGLEAGPTIYWPAGCYVLGGTLSITHSVVMQGEGIGVGGGGVATRWTFPANTPGVVVTRYNIWAGVRVAPRRSGGEGTILRNILLSGTSAAKPDDTSHGVSCVATCVLENLDTDNFAGDGIHIVADSGIGNANGFRVVGARITNAGRYGMFIAGSDANAGVTINAIVAHSGGACFVDNGFLGNAHLADQGASCSEGLVTATARGRVYQCLGSGHAGANLCAVTPPGTNGEVWYDLGPGSNSPQGRPSRPWIRGAPYLIGGGFVSTDRNSRTTWYNPYSERGNGPSHIKPPSMAINPAWGEAPTMTTAEVTTDAGALMSPTGFSSVGRLPGATGGVVFSEIGGDPSSGQILRFGEEPDGEVWRLQFDGGGDIVLRAANRGLATLFKVTTHRTGLRFGRPAPQPYAFIFPAGYWLGGGGAESARQVVEASAMPLSGSWAKGDRVLNNAPAILGPPGGRYTVTGWLRMTTGSANQAGVDWVEMRSSTGG